MTKVKKNLSYDVVERLREKLPNEIVNDSVVLASKVDCGIIKIDEFGNRLMFKEDIREGINLKLYICGQVYDVYGLTIDEVVQKALDKIEKTNAS